MKAALIPQTRRLTFGPASAEALANDMNPRWFWLFRRLLGWLLPALLSFAETDTVRAQETAPRINTQAQSQTVAAGVTVTFSADACGNPGPSYQ